MSCLSIQLVHFKMNFKEQCFRTEYDPKFSSESLKFVQFMLPLRVVYRPDVTMLNRVFLLRIVDKAT
jgi:hypothetical protein